MRKVLQKSVALLIVLGFVLPSFAGVVPTADDGKWYYVQSERHNTGATNPGPWWTKTASNKIIPHSLSKTDAQKFTLVTSSAGKVTIKAFDGTKFNGMTFDATGTTNGWTITPGKGMKNVIDGASFPGQSSGLHQGAGGWNWEVHENYYNLNGYSTFFFYEADEDVELEIDIDEAEILKSETVAGNNPGQTPQSAIDDYTLAINTAKATLGSTDATAIQNAINALATATTTFINAENELVTSSTAANPVWYLIKNVGRNNANVTAYTDGFGNLMRCVYQNIPADGTGTNAQAPALKYLYRFEKQADGTYKIENAAFISGSGGIQKTADGGNSSQHIKYTGVSSNWDLQYLGEAPTGRNQMKIVADNNSTWHCAGWKGIVSWGGGLNSPSAWYVEEYTGNVDELYKSLLQETLNIANNLYQEVSEGTDFGQVPANSDQKDNLHSEINSAQAVYDNNASTNNDLLTATNQLKTKINEYRAIINQDVNALVSTDNTKYRWYTIRSTSSHAYATGKVISSNGRNVGEKYTYEEVGSPVTKSQLFRFQIVNAQQKKVNIIDKNGNSIAQNGSISSSTTLKEFSLSLITDDYSFNINPAGASPIHAQENGAHIVNWPGDRGSSSAWVFDFVKEMKLNWIGNSYITIGGKNNNGTWYDGTGSGHSSFNGANLGDKEAAIVLGGEIQAYHPVTEGISMGYKILDGADPQTANVVVAETYVALPKIGDQDNNSKHYAETSVDISGLTKDETYYLHVWFKGVEGANAPEWDSNMGNNYVATFTKIETSTGVEEATLSQGVSVNNGIITVKGVKDFEVYSLAGQQINAKQALQAGVYIVKVKDTAVKVVVK